MPFISNRNIVAASALVALAGVLLFASPSAQVQTPNLRIEGDWVRIDSEGAGDFGGLAAQFPTAALMPEAEAGRNAGGRAGRGGRGRGGAQADEARGPLAPGEFVVTSTMPCSGGRGGYGGLLITPDSGGVHFVEGKGEVIFAGERGGVRHIYTDGRTHPDPSRWTPTGAGHSIGRYEGRVLVAETVGLTAGAVPGGGQRTPETVFTERFEVAPDGMTMAVTYTWNDPKIYQKPHTYTITFGRAPAVNGVSWAFDEWCDASDPIEGQSIVVPTQIE